jgi:photosystem II stability/assembly factor-like uncharacterized protein
MKKLITFLAVLLLTQAAQAQWAIVGQAFTGTVRTVYFFDENIGLAAGGDGVSLGYVSRTTDGGLTWSSTTVSGTILLRAFSFVDSSTGYLCGHGGVLLKTTDGGQTWTNIYTNATQTFRAIAFTSESTGFMAGAAGTIWSTTDGGLTWTSKSLGITSDVIQLKMLDKNNGYAVCSGGIAPFANGYVFKTTDGGATWSQVYNNAGIGLLGMAVVDINEIYAGGTNQNIYQSTDGGATWSNVHTGLTGPAIRTGVAVTSQRIVMADDNGYFQQTDDGGASWTNVFYAPGGIFGMHFPNSDLGFAGDISGNIWKYDATADCAVNPPQFFGTSYITPYSAVLSWEAIPGAVKYSVRMRSYYGVTSFNSVATAQQVTGLNPDTKYIWQVKSYCGTPISGSSTWSAKTSFFTDPLKLSSTNQLSFFEVYPNPVNQTATVRFDLEEESKVRAVLCSMDGKEMMVIGQGQYPSGANQLSFDRGLLEAGIYILKLNTGDQLVTQKIVIQ